MVMKLCFGLRSFVFEEMRKSKIDYVSLLAGKRLSMSLRYVMISGLEVGLFGKLIVALLDSNAETILKA
jgi:hypothetical protein